MGNGSVLHRFRLLATTTFLLLGYTTTTRPWVDAFSIHPFSLPTLSLRTTPLAVDIVRTTKTQPQPHRQHNTNARPEVSRWTNTGTKRQRRTHQGDNVGRPFCHRMSNLCRLSASDNNNNNNVNESDSGGGWKVSLTGISTTSTKPSSSSNIESLSPSSPLTTLIDTLLSILTSDIGSITLGLLGLLIILTNRLSSIDYDSAIVPLSQADAMGTQSRSDLLAVFAAGAVLLNGISKLDVTSVTADTVVLDGVDTDVPLVWRERAVGKCKCGDTSNENDLVWAMEAVLDATPADSVVVVVSDEWGSSSSPSSPLPSSSSSSSSWVPVAMGGILPQLSATQPERVLGQRLNIPTPILDRFLRAPLGSTRESYLPTVQALPGKTELTYLPRNVQEALLVPILLVGKEDQEDKDKEEEEGEEGEMTKRAVLVLGGATAKSFSPKDVAWCQVVAARMGKNFPKSIRIG